MSIKKLCYLILFSCLGFNFACTALPESKTIAGSASPTTPAEILHPTQTQTVIPVVTLSPTIIVERSAVPVASATERAISKTRFAVIGDYGSGNQNAACVASLVNSWAPDFVITTGDNNYPLGSSSTIDENIGRFYHFFILNYSGSYGEGSIRNRFFPTLGNHDWMTKEGQPYFDYFTLPGNERYYDFTWGPLHFFALDSDSREPDGVGRNSIQAEWLQDGLSVDNLPWKIVYMHHPPYSSGMHGSVDWMQWPFEEWGVSAVFSGHDHVYERLLIGGIPYIINGLGGGVIYYFDDIVDGSQVRYNADYGAVFVEADFDTIEFNFITCHNQVIDSYQVSQ